MGSKPLTKAEFNQLFNQKKEELMARLQEKLARDLSEFQREIEAYFEPTDIPNPNDYTPQERAEIFLNWANSHKDKVYNIPLESLRRENLY